MPDIMHLVKIRAAPERVYQALTTAEDIRNRWEGTTLSFDLRAEGSDTVLSFAHRGFNQADEGYARVTTGWAYYLISLQQYLETGKGARRPDIDFARVIS
jgi:hypothetical protein